MSHRRAVSRKSCVTSITTIRANPRQSEEVPRLRSYRGTQSPTIRGCSRPDEVELRAASTNQHTAVDPQCRGGATARSMTSDSAEGLHIDPEYPTVSTKVQAKISCYLGGRHRRKIVKKRSRCSRRMPSNLWIRRAFWRIRFLLSRRPRPVEPPYELPPDCGVREPRRPRPIPGAGAAALPEPNGFA